MNKSRGWLLGVAIILVLMVVLARKYSRSDFRVAVINGNGLELGSVSTQRRMVNTVKVGKEVEVWIPNGLGWYKSGKILEVLNQEKKNDLVGEMFFYNFGFIPDVIIYGETNNWLTDWRVVSRWGWFNYLDYQLNNARIMIRDVEIKDDLLKPENDLAETAQRDLADSRLLREDIRISIFNASKSTGLAGFVSRSLEMAGFTVVGVDNYPEKVDQCYVSYGGSVGSSYGYGGLKKIWGGCKWQKSDKLGGLEVELYFGDSYSQMLNYQSYVRTL